MVVRTGAVGNCGGGAWLVVFFDGGTFCSIVVGGGSDTGCDGVAGNDCQHRDSNTQPTQWT